MEPSSSQADKARCQSQNGIWKTLLCFHASMLIFTGKGHDSLCISCFYFASALWCTHLIWGLGLLKIFMWFTPEMAILGGGTGFTSLNYKKAELFSGYKIEALQEGSEDFYLTTILQRKDTNLGGVGGGIVLVLGSSGTTLTCGAEGCRNLCVLGMPRASINIRLCFILTWRLMLRP